MISWVYTLQHDSWVFHIIVFCIYSAVNIYYRHFVSLEDEPPSTIPLVVFGIDFWILFYYIIVLVTSNSFVISTLTPTAFFHETLFYLFFTFIFIIVIFIMVHYFSFFFMLVIWLVYFVTIVLHFRVMNALFRPDWIGLHQVGQLYTNIIMLN